MSDQDPVAEPPDDDDRIVVGPINGDARPPDWDQGFSLKQLLWMMAGAAAACGMLRWLFPAVAAGVSGLAVLLGMVLISIGDPPAILRLAWWILLAFYLVASVMAAMPAASW